MGLEHGFGRVRQRVKKGSKVKINRNTCLIHLIGIITIDPFMHLLEYKVIVCIKCKYAVLLNNIDTHLRDENTHNIAKESKGLIVQEIQKIQGLITSKSDLNRLIFPLASNPPIPVLQEPRIDGKKC
jgi:hypothetical protein